MKCWWSKFCNKYNFDNNFFNNKWNITNFNNERNINILITYEFYKKWNFNNNFVNNERNITNFNNERNIANFNNKGNTINILITKEILLIF